MVQFIFNVLVPSILSLVNVRLISCVHLLADGNLILRLIKFLRAWADPFVYIKMCSFQAQACALPGGPWRNQRHERWDRETGQEGFSGLCNEHVLCQGVSEGNQRQERWDRETRQEGFSGLKGHGNEADFLGFLQKSARHRFLTLHFELRIRGDIRNRKCESATLRLAESGS